MRILIVDDTIRARQSMKALLEVWYPQVEIHEATNGREAIQMTEECRLEIILMDARMPGMSSLEATRQIKASYPQMKVIILSVFPDYQALALEAGADGFLSKSDPPDRLRQMITEVMNNS